MALAAEKGVDFKKLNQQKKRKEALKKKSSTSTLGGVALSDKDIQDEEVDDGVLSEDDAVDEDQAEEDDEGEESVCPPQSRRFQHPPS